jgi:uncharacterized membrane protein
MKEQISTFLIGSAAYPMLEIIWRGHSHVSMALAGGLSVYAIHEICNVRLHKRPLLLKCLAGACIITGIELVTGLVVNEWLQLHVWDYSRLPLNIMGQICLPFSILWALLTIPAMGIGLFCTSLKKK